MTNKLNAPMDKFWPAITYPLSYKDALNTMTKDELTSVRTILQISNVSNLNKQTLIDKLQKLIPDNIGETIRNWDRKRTQLIQKIVSGNGRWSQPLLEIQQYEYFRNRGILFPGTVDGNRMLIMPSELVGWFKSANLSANSDIIKRNTEWIQLSRGLLYYYGTLTLGQLEELVFSYSNKKIGIRDFMDVLIDAMDYYDEMMNDSAVYFSDFRVVDSDKIRREQAARASLDFYPFTKEQIMKAGEPDFVDRNVYYVELVRFLLAHYELDRKDADLMVDEWADAARNGDSLAEVMQSVQEFVDIDDMETMSAIADRLVPLMNSTRQWVLKGYSPDELSASRGNGNRNLSTTPKQATKADVISLQTKQRIGRNDPCPCGSGKKFKKCCS
ncbi:YecA family protein [Cohnella luojiensis]|nr:SEC-C metal-binding domain-containing protein [Cohnella luojiensis]